MRLRFICTECARDEDRPAGSTAPPTKGVVTLPIQHSGVYRFECDDGHKSVCVHQQMLFEVLSEVAVQAIVDGYYRDAVSSFTAAIERTYEVYFQLIARVKGCEPSAVKSTWKMVAKQSERQFGLFAGIYLFETGRTAPTLSQKAVAFRNQVVHQGYIPSEDEAVEFGQEALSTIFDVMRDAKERYFDQLMDLVGQRSREAASEVPRGTITATVAHSTPYSIAFSNAEKPDLAALVARRRTVARR